MFSLLEGPFGGVFSQSGTSPSSQIAPTITTTVLPPATVGSAYTAQLQATGSPNAFTWTLTSGNKPAWLTVSSSGLLSGTPASGDVTTGINLTFSCSNGVSPNANSGNLGLVVNAASAGAPVLTASVSISAWPGPGQATPAPNPPYSIPNILVVNPATWQNQYPFAGYPVQRRHQWIKDGVDIPGAMGLSYSPSTSGSYSVRETAWFLNTTGNVFSDGPSSVNISTPVTVTGTKDAALVYISDISYLGAFRPQNPSGASSDFETFSYGGRGLAFDPAGNGGQGSLFAIGCGNGPQQVGEFAIPAQSTWATNDSQAVPQGTFLNGTTLFDPSEGRKSIPGNPATLRGIAIDGNEMVFSYCDNYTYSPAGWIWKRPKNRNTTGQVKGPFSITDTAVWDNARAYGGYIAKVPTSLQTKLGGTYIMGQIAQSVASTTSDGPTVASFSTTTLDATNDKVLTGLTVESSLSGSSTFYVTDGSSVNGYYVGSWFSPNASTDQIALKITAYNGTTKIATLESAIIQPILAGTGYTIVPHSDAKALGLWRTPDMKFQDWEVGYTGVYFPTLYDPRTDDPYATVIEGTRSVLVFSSGGNGVYTYAIGSGPTPSNGEVAGNGIRAYDPNDNSRGEHSYPYYTRCFAFDANDLEQARLGNILPKNVKPYAVWNFVPPFKPTSNNNVLGATYDSLNKRLYLSYGPVLAGGNPIIHVYSVNNVV